MTTHSELKVKHEAENSIESATLYIKSLEEALVKLTEAMKNAGEAFQTVIVILNRCQSMLDHGERCECSDCFELDEAIALVVEDIEDRN